MADTTRRTSHSTSKEKTELAVTAGRPVRGALLPPQVTAITSTRAGSLAIFIVRDRKSTRLNSSHSSISYAVFCLKKKKIKTSTQHQRCGLHSQPRYRVVP